MGTADRERYERYAAKRDARRLKDTDVATLAGINQSTLSHWKSGFYTPKVDKLQKIAAVLEIGIEELL